MLTSLRNCPTLLACIMQQQQSNTPKNLQRPAPAKPYTLDEVLIASASSDQTQPYPVERPSEQRSLDRFHSLDLSSDLAVISEQKINVTADGEPVQVIPNPPVFHEASPLLRGPGEIHAVVSTHCIRRSSVHIT